MNKPTQKQIEDEISALEGCKAYVPRKTAFGDDNHAKLDLQIKYLRGEIDTTADDEWEDFTDDEQSSVLEAEYWKNGDEKESPSSGWDNFKPKAKKP